MESLPFSSIAFIGGLSLLLLGGLSLRLMFAPENAQDKAVVGRIKGLQGDPTHSVAEALVRNQSRQSVGRVWPIVGDLALKIRRAGLEGKETQLVIFTVAGGLALSLALILATGSYFAAPLGFALAGFAAHSVLKYRHKKRADTLIKQLPDALDLIMRGLRVGHPVNATIGNVGRTMADPIGAEFRGLAEQISHGDYLTDAFSDMAERIGQEDVEYLAVAISIQHGTGGNLAEMLGTLSKVVRDRIIMRRRIKAISSEGRISAYLLSALPVAIYLATTISAPDYYGAVSDDPLFRPIGMTIIALVVANFLALRKLVSFDF